MLRCQAEYICIGWRVLHVHEIFCGGRRTDAVSDISHEIYIYIYIFICIFIFIYYIFPVDDQAVQEIGAKGFQLGSEPW